jgi:hypothetical protein
MNSNSLKISNENLKRRLNAERRFKFYGVIAISLALIFVLILFTNIVDFKLFRSVFSSIF